MSVKILRRTHAPLMRPAPAASSSLPGLFSSKVNDIRDRFASMFTQASRARKSADPEGFSVPDRIREFFFQNAPSIASGIDMEKIGEMVKGLKLPLLVAVGVAAAAGIAYLVYKLYTNRATIAESVDSVMNDLKSVAPDLTKIDGWADSIKKEVTDAFASGNPNTAFERLVKIKDAVMGHQHSISGHVGSGINHLVRQNSTRRYYQPRRLQGRGAGLKSPMN